MESNSILELFITFLKIGAFTFGGGYSMIPLIQKEVIEKKKWISDQDLLEIIAIAESTPGPIAVNAATFIGYKLNGFIGAVLTTIGVILPSFIIIFIITFMLKQFENIQAVQNAFSGIRIGVLALIIKALIKMYKQCSKNILSHIIMGMCFILVAFFKFNIFIVLIGSALLSVINTAIAERRKTI